MEEIQLLLKKAASNNTNGLAISQLLLNRLLNGNCFSRLHLISAFIFLIVYCNLKVRSVLENKSFQLIVEDLCYLDVQSTINLL